MDISEKLSSILPTTHINKAGTTHKPDAIQPTHSVAKGDQVRLSPQARELQAARAAAAEMPEIREEKVAAIRAQLEAGTYSVDSEKIAENMIDEGLINAHLK